MFGYSKTSTSPIAPPVITIDDIKRHPLLKINYNLDDDILQNECDAAVELVEGWTRRAIQQNIYTFTFQPTTYTNDPFWQADLAWEDQAAPYVLQRHFPRWLPMPPTQSILSFTIDDVPFTDYTIDTTLEPARIHYTKQPTGNVVVIEAVAGYVIVPAMLVKAIRQAAAEGHAGIDRTESMEYLLQSWKIWL